MKFLGFGTGILFGTVTGYAAHFPQIYMQAIMSGNGVAGVVIALLRIVTKVTVTGSCMLRKLPCLNFV